MSRYPSPSRKFVLDNGPFHGHLTSSSGGVNIDRACMECFDCNDGLSLDLRGCEAHSQSGTPVGLPVIGYSFYKKWELG